MSQTATNRRADPFSTGTLGLAVVCAGIFLVPAVLNGYPFLFYDSDQYHAIGGAIIEKIAAAIGVSPGPLSGAEGAGPLPQVAGAVAEPGGGLAAIAGGRSPVFSVFVYLASLSSLWIVPVVQALVVAWLVVRFLDLVWERRRVLATVAVAGGLAALSSAGFFVSFIMPDVFAAVLVLAALILALDRQAGPAETVVLVLLAAAACVMHNTIMALALTAAVLFLLCLLMPWSRRLVRPAAPAFIFAAAVASIGFGAAYSAAFGMLSEDQLRSPPFLAARVIADGPGMRFLAEHCVDDRAPTPYCSFRGLTFANHNDFLWGGYGALKNFSTVPPELRSEIQAGEMDFVSSVIRTYPAEALRAAFGNAVSQTVSFGIPEIWHGAEAMLHASPSGGDGILGSVPQFASCLAEPSDCPPRSAARETWNTTIVVIHGLSLFAFLLVVLALTRTLAREQPADAQPAARVLLCGALLGALLLANAAVCGALSGPHHRYQARLVWLMPLFLAGAGVGRTLRVKLAVSSMAQATNPRTQPR